MIYRSFPVKNKEYGKEKLIDFAERFMLADRWQWKQKDWTIIKLSDMDDAHLMNTFRLFQFNSILAEIFKRFNKYKTIS